MTLSRTSFGTVAGGQVTTTAATQLLLENGLPSRSAILEELITLLHKQWMKLDCIQLTTAGDDGTIRAWDL